MSVHAQKFAVYSMDVEQFVVDDRNNNLKNDQIMEKQQTVIQKKSDILIDEFRLKYQNSEYKMEKHSNDMQQCETHSSGQTKSSTPLNFSMDSILSSTNSAKKNENENFDRKIVTSQQSITEDCRIYRPMPMRYLSNPPFLQGNHNNVMSNSNKFQKIQRRT